MSTINQQLGTTDSQEDSLASVKCWIGKSRKWAESFFSELNRLKNVKTVVLLGSTIRQRVHPRSDFDILLVYEGVEPPKVNAPIEVDLRMYSANELDKKLGERDEILCWALKYGIVAFDSDGLWASLAVKVGDQIPLPSRAEAESRGRKSLNRAIEMLDNHDEEAADDLVLAALTQIARGILIAWNVFPASRPELPSQLRSLFPHHPVADVLDEAMFGNSSPSKLIDKAKLLIDQLSRSDSIPKH